MQESKKNDKFGPQIADPTDKEIEETIEKVKSKYDIIIQRDDAINFTKLTKKLSWWMIVERGLKDPNAITRDMAKEVQKFTRKNYNNNISLDEASRHAKDSITHIIPVEKERIAEEIRSIIAKYQ